jgi:hypothetical protein
MHARAALVFGHERDCFGLPGGCCLASTPRTREPNHERYAKRLAKAIEQRLCWSDLGLPRLPPPSPQRKLADSAMLQNQYVLSSTVKGLLAHPEQTLKGPCSQNFLSGVREDHGVIENKRKRFPMCFLKLLPGYERSCRVSNPGGRGRDALAIDRQLVVHLC